MSDRLTRQQLKEDPLLQGTSDAADYAKDHMRLIIGVAAALIVLSSVIYFVRTGAARGKEQAAAMLIEAKTELKRGALEAAAGRLEELTRDHGGTTSGKAGLLVYGDVRFAQGQYQEADEYYRRAAEAYSKDAVLSDAARRGRAACLENLSRHEEAAELYLSLAESASNEVMAADTRMAVARNYMKAGRQGEAIAIYEELSRNFSNPQVAQSAQLRLAEAKAAAAG